MRSKKRQAKIERNTKEVNIECKFTVDGSGKSNIKSGFKSLDHMLTLFAFHGLFDLDLKAAGDLEHHIVEDIGIVLGSAVKRALDDARNIKRFGLASVTMDCVMATVSIDISGRPYLRFDVAPLKENLDLSKDDFKTFLEAFVSNAKITLHVALPRYEKDQDAHHSIEAIFKALGVALDMATQVDARRKGIPSTKGVID